MQNHSSITTLLAAVVLIPVIGLGLGWGAWLYADALTGAKLKATASIHVVKAPLHVHDSPLDNSGRQSMSGRNLYTVYCAECHGETGDGNGTRQLDRQARSFKDGGFSFGNTSTALFRTISSGISGTPMPGFADSLSVLDRRALAEYVQTLGPPVLEIATSDTILEVRDTPLVVRGHLPALGPDLPEHPRGLLVGSTDGLSFQFSADDVRLLAVRQGSFVERSDWTGRGGTPLKPLGRVIDLIDGGRPGPTIDLGSTTSARLLGTTINADRAIVRYEVERTNQSGTIRVEEWAEAASLPAGSGYRRHLSLSAQGEVDGAVLRLAGDGPPHVPVIVAGSETDRETVWVVQQREDGQYLLQGVTSSFPISSHDIRPDMTIPLPAQEQIRLEVTTLIVPGWNDQVHETLARGGVE